MPDKLGRFQKGEHWRKPQAFREKEYLQSEYIDKARSCSDIASDFNVTEAAILFWLRKHNIPRRTVKEAREVKHWGLSGEKNGMFGKTGNQNPRWLGGITPERQAFYCSKEWAQACSFVWKRDKATCQRCGVKDAPMHIHHLVSFSNVALRSDAENLVLVCRSCHNFIHSKKNTGKEFIK